MCGSFCFISMSPLSVAISIQARSYVLPANIILVAKMASVDSIAMNADLFHETVSAVCSMMGEGQTFTNPAAASADGVQIPNPSESRLLTGEAPAASTRLNGKQTRAPAAKGQKATETDTGGKGAETGKTTPEKRRVEK